MRGSMISTRTTKSGSRRYDVRLRDPQGKTYTRTFGTKKEAVAFEARERADRSRGAWIDPRRSSVTVADVATAWLASNPGKRSSARARDESVIRLRVLPTFGDRHVGAVTPADVQSAVNAWAAVRAPRTVEREYGVVRAIFAYALAAEYIGRTPCRGIRLPEAEARRRHVVTPDELALIAEAMGRNGAMAYVGAILGLRWGECAGLRVGRLDFFAGTLAVAEQVTRGEGGKHYAGPPKSAAGRRTLAMPNALVQLLAAHLARLGLTAADADAWVFPGTSNSHLEYSGWRRRTWLPAVAAAGLEGLEFHDLRRACATGLVATGTDAKTAQARLGHADVRLTLGLYAQVVTDLDRKAAEAVGGWFLGDPRDGRAMGAGLA
jgi:integrase